jgi:hypothetical protein
VTQSSSECSRWKCPFTQRRLRSGRHGVARQ